MKYLIRIIAVIAVIGIMATILASCKGNDTSNTETTVANTTTVNATTVADETLPAGTEVTLITQTDAQGNTVVVAKPTTGKVTKPDATQPTVKTTKAPVKTTAKKTSAPARDEDDFSKMVYTTKTYSDGSFDIICQNQVLRVVRTNVFSRYTAYTNSHGEVCHDESEGKRLYLVVGTQCTYCYLNDDGVWCSYI